MLVVTGADGVVGRAVCEGLVKSGQVYIPVVRHRKAITPRNAFITDLSQIEGLEPLKNKEIRGIIHLAAAVPHSTRYPDTDKSAELTRRIDQNIIRFNRSIHAPIVYMSTCGLYDRLLAADKCEDNDSQIKIASPYFSAKRDGERLFSQEANAVVMRLSAPVGPGQKPSVVLSRFIMAARMKLPIEIWGSGSREQNFVDVRDVANLILKAVANPVRCTLNVASKSPTTMIDLARIVIDVIGGGMIQHSDCVDPRDGETARYSIARAWDLYKWVPQFSLSDSCRLIAREDFEANS